jgi:hypothetical protein
MDNGVSAYIEATRARLKADGCETRDEGWNGSTVLIGYRSDFRLRWLATNLHLFTIVAPAASVTAPAIEGFTTACLDYAIGRKGQLRGLQSGVAVLPALVTAVADDPAIAWASEKQRMRFAAFARPVVVDTTRGLAACFRGSTAIGAIYSGHLRTKLAAYFPAT